ncbi:MAG: DNA repair protein RecO [Clostridia bacterium]
MASEMIRTKALIVRTANSGDNDRVLTAVSPELGKMSIIAKGVRSLKNKNSTATGILCYSDLVLKQGRELYSLVSAECVEGFYHLRDSVEGVAYGMYFASLLESCTEVNVPADEELRLALNTLYALTRRPQDGAVLKLVYELRLAEVMGIAPYISEECQCGRKAVYFSVANGETCCELHKDSSSIKLKADEMTVVEYILTSELKEALFFRTPPEILSGLSNFGERYLEYHIGRLPKTLDYLKNILKNPT